MTEYLDGRSFFQSGEHAEEKNFLHGSCIDREQRIENRSNLLQVADLSLEFVRLFIVLHPGTPIPQNLYRILI